MNTKKIELPLEYEANLRSLEISLKNHGAVSPDVMLRTYRSWFVDRYILALVSTEAVKLRKQNKSNQKIIKILYCLVLAQMVIFTAYVLLELF